MTITQTKTILAIDGAIMQIKNIIEGMDNREVNKKREILTNVSNANYYLIKLMGTLK